MKQFKPASAWVAGFLVLVLPFATRADEVFLMYLGGGVGESRINVSALNTSGHDVAWKILAGVRAADFLGAEVAYVNLGRPRSTIASGRVDTQASGPVAFAIAYLPLAVSNVDLYAKAGVANIQQRATVTLSSGANACVAGLSCEGLNRTESEFAWGGGAQLRAGPVSIRLEYEQFRASGGDLNLGSVGFLWNFL